MFKGARIKIIKTANTIENMLDLSTCLKHYKRQEVQKQLVGNASRRELGVKYAKGHFGKRPDMLQNEADVLEFAKQGVTSFHISEEIWDNPLALSPLLKKKDLDKKRIGWDLIIDVDCPDWELSKRISFVIVKALKNHGISSISCKFSGNKGFHIGVPFKCFPEKVQAKASRGLFPDLPKRIMNYIAFYAKRHFSDEILQGLDAKRLSKKLDVAESELIQEVCTSCNRLFKSKLEDFFYICDKCGTQVKKQTFEEYITCPKCRATVRILDKASSKRCIFCKSNSIKKEINLTVILGLDHILISPRHLYRMAYSLHEKSGLVSLPINPFSVLAFDKKDALPENVSVKYTFLDDEKVKPGEASDLVLKSIDFEPKGVEEHTDRKDFGSKYPGYSGKFNGTEFDDDENAEKLPVELFPPCILKLSQGLRDGRKRGVFILVNFLTSVGWDYPDVEDYIYKWNEKNEEHLRETVIKSQINYHKIQKKKVLPPNCSNKMYYADLGICCPDELCSRIKNPVNYSKKKAYFLNRQNSRKKKKKDEGKKSETKETGSKGAPKTHNNTHNNDMPKTPNNSK